MLAISFIIIGVISVVAGVIIHYTDLFGRKRILSDKPVGSKGREMIYSKDAEPGLSEKKLENFAKQNVQENPDNAQRIIENLRESGNSFKVFVGTKFNSGFFRLKEWTGNRTASGLNSRSLFQPDLIIGFRMGNVESTFAIECKFHNYYTQYGLEVANERQIYNYQKFQRKYDIPVFIALGVGGKEDNPEDFYLIPLNCILSPFLTRDFLLKYRKRNFKERVFYFDTDKLVLI